MQKKDNKVQSKGACPQLTPLLLSFPRPQRRVGERSGRCGVEIRVGSHQNNRILSGVRSRLHRYGNSAVFLRKKVVEPRIGEKTSKREVRKKRAKRRCETLCDTFSMSTDDERFLTYRITIKFYLF